MQDFQQRVKEKGYALFDLDQTLIPWDTQLLFANWIVKKYPLRRFYLVLVALFLPLVKVLGAGGMKRVFVSYLYGLQREDLEVEVEEFVDWLIPRYIYEEIWEELKKHTREGRPVILTSASPEIYVSTIGRRLGSDFSFGTRFDYEEQFPLFPDFVTNNNKGMEKLVRIREELGELPEHDQSYGYSDSSADLPMLRICKHVTMVNPTNSLLSEGEVKGWKLSILDRPSRSKFAFIKHCLQQSLGAFGLEKTEM